MANIKNSILIYLGILLFLIITYFQFGDRIQKYFEIQEVETQNEETVKKAIVSPNTTYLDVPFICQAPLQTEANWVFHEESCEEAALLQTYLYETGQKMTAEQANEEILNMISWQEANLDSHHDLYADEMKKFAKGYYDLDDDDIKICAAGIRIIEPGHRHSTRTMCKPDIT